MLNERDHWPHFRTHSIIWTPTISFLDRLGHKHYESVGFLPPPEFGSALRIGRARCLLAWTRAAEAAHDLLEVADTGGTMAPEALYWLGIARFMERKETTGMWAAWRKLLDEYPDSAW